MNETEFYQAGYADGYHGVAASAAYVNDPNYEMGYQDGKGDRDSKAEVRGVKSPYTDPHFYEENEPPEGYIWDRDFRTPLKGEVYLTKNGNAGVAKDHPKNGRQRHMLKAIHTCPRIGCVLAAGHSGKCSFQLVK